jgi:hypothetical protein
MVYIRKMGAEKTCPKIIRARPLFLMMSWIVAHKKLDCPMTCRENFALKYVMMGGVDHKDGKPISVCTTKKDRNGEWLVGNNRW